MLSIPACTTQGMPDVVVRASDRCRRPALGLDTAPVPADVVSVAVKA
jgi:hypothetical protein